MNLPPLTYETGVEFDRQQRPQGVVHVFDEGGRRVALIRESQPLAAKRLAQYLDVPIDEGRAILAAAVREARLASSLAATGQL